MMTSEIAAAAGARDVACAFGTEIRDVVIDSRQARNGSLFVAIKGEHADGHDYVVAAAAAGAVSLVERPVSVPHIEVDDCVGSLGRIGRAVYDRSRATIVGITGSSGRPTTRDLLLQVLAAHAETVATQGPFDNEILLPLTVCRITSDTRYVVLEMSARDVGHITYLTTIAPPDVAVVLNGAVAHAPANGELVTGELLDGLPQTGLAVLNADDDNAISLAGRTSARLVRYGAQIGCEYRADDVRLDDAGRARFRLQAPRGAAEVSLRLVGEHMVGNALAAAAVACELGVPVDVTAAALSAAEPLGGWCREVTENDDGVTVINDARNADPDSVIAALKTLKSMSRGRRGWAVLGAMDDVGERSVGEHTRVGQMVVRLGIDKLLTVGAGARVIHDTYLVEGALPGDATHVESADEAVGFLTAALRRDDVVLVKASRAAGLERVALALAPDGGTS